MKQDGNKQDFHLEAQGKHKEPFSVPNGYFDQFAERLMAQIPEDTATAEKANAPVRTTLFARIKPYLYLAAMFGGLYFGLHVFKYQAEKMSGEEKAATAQEQAETSQMDQYVNDLLMYANVDHQDVYAYATAEDYGQ